VYLEGLRGGMSQAKEPRSAAEEESSSEEEELPHKSDSPEQQASGGSSDEADRSGEDEQEGDRKGDEEGDGDDSASDASSDRPATSEVVVQSGEAVDLQPFSGKVTRPMMEMVSGSNVWYQAIVQDTRQDKLLVLFPPPSRKQQARKEWVLRTSSRIWRGSMSTREWKYLSSGAWAPKEGKAKSAARTAAARKRAAASTGSGGRWAPAASPAGTDATPSGDAANSEAAARGASGGAGEEPDVASPRKKSRGPSAAVESADPLAVWFSHHFAMLDQAGQLGDKANGGTTESGWMPSIGCTPEGATADVKRPRPGSNPKQTRPPGSQAQAIASQLGAESKKPRDPRPDSVDRGSGGPTHGTLQRKSEASGVLGQPPVQALSATARKAAAAAATSIISG